jgi:hypothetical protein
MYTGRSQCSLRRAALVLLAACLAAPPLHLWVRWQSGEDRLMSNYENIRVGTPLSQAIALLGTPVGPSSECTFTWVAGGKCVQVEYSPDGERRVTRKEVFTDTSLPVAIDWLRGTR